MIYCRIISLALAVALVGNAVAAPVPVGDADAALIYRRIFSKQSSGSVAHVELTNSQTHAQGHHIWQQVADKTHETEPELHVLATQRAKDHKEKKEAATRSHLSHTGSVLYIPFKDKTFDAAKTSIDAAKTSIIEGQGHLDRLNGLHKRHY